MYAKKNKPMYGKGGMAKLAQYMSGGTIKYENGGPTPSESTSVRKPIDPYLLAAASEGAQFEQNELNRMTGGLPSGRIDSSGDPLFEILSMVGPGGLKKIGSLLAKGGAAKSSGKIASRSIDDVMPREAAQSYNKLADDYDSLLKERGNLRYNSRSKDSFEFDRLNSQMDEIAKKQSDITEGYVTGTRVGGERFGGPQDSAEFMEDLRNYHRGTPREGYTSSSPVGIFGKEGAKRFQYGNARMGLNAKEYEQLLKESKGLLEGKYAMGGKMKYKKGGFPDLTGDGKVTMADILKGRGVGK